MCTRTSWMCSELQALYSLCMYNHAQPRLLWKILFSEWLTVIFLHNAGFSWATDNFLKKKKTFLKYYSLCSKPATVHFRTDLMIDFPEQNSLFSNLVAKCLFLENTCFPGIINHTLLGSNQLLSLFSHPF